VGQFWYAFDSQKGKQYHYFDVIKVKAEKSSELIAKHSLMCKLLALKANDRKTDPEKLVYEIYRAVALMKNKLTNEQLLLIDQWVSFYKKVSEPELEKIKKEIKMDFIETTITEHVYNQGWIEGETKGEVKGRKKTAMNLLNMGVDVKFISQATGFDEKEIKQLTAR
jgi:uncharacterized protein (DUF2164 family)